MGNGVAVAACAGDGVGVRAGCSVAVRVGDGVRVGIDVASGPEHARNRDVAKKNSNPKRVMANLQ